MRICVKVIFYFYRNLKVHKIQLYNYFFITLKKKRKTVYIILGNWNHCSTECIDLLLEIYNYIMIKILYHFMKQDSVKESKETIKVLSCGSQAYQRHFFSLLIKRKNFPGTRSDSAPRSFKREQSRSIAPMRSIVSYLTHSVA